ncbi:hypothetical protein EBB79_08870 [Parasedimentitalea marina]|uniref:Uncharacterized protein n=1 Tax=Parasedimentitalea marina TaxID=2483033 RepID=A0A3T0N1U6_9RHOB|nr:hypothetical protein EBB79_08870 [Parasedimentitalea marina]
MAIIVKPKNADLQPLPVSPRILQPLSEGRDALVDRVRRVLVSSVRNSALQCLEQLEVVVHKASGPRSSPLPSAFLPPKSLLKIPDILAPKMHMQLADRGIQRKGYQSIGPTEWLFVPPNNMTTFAASAFAPVSQDWISDYT